jgi:hypothetical protein
MYIKKFQKSLKQLNHSKRFQATTIFLLPKLSVSMPDGFSGEQRRASELACHHLVLGL